MTRISETEVHPHCHFAGCGRHGKTYSLFAGSGQTLSSGTSAAQPTAAAAPPSNDAAALRAVGI